MSRFVATCKAKYSGRRRLDQQLEVLLAFYTSLVDEDARIGAVVVPNPLPMRIL